MKTLPELIIEGFDAEQVWAGVNLQNKTKFQKFTNKVETLTQLIGNSEDTSNRTKNFKNVKDVGKLESFGDTFNLLTGGKSASENCLNENNSDYEQDDDLHELNIDKWPRKKDAIQEPINETISGKI